MTNQVRAMTGAKQQVLHNTRVFVSPIPDVTVVHRVSGPINRQVWHGVSAILRRYWWTR